MKLSVTNTGWIISSLPMGWLDELCSELSPRPGSDTLEELQRKRQLLDVVLQVCDGPVLGTSRNERLGLEKPSEQLQQNMSADPRKLFICTLCGLHGM